MAESKGAGYGGSGGSKHEVPPQKEGGSDAAGPASGKRSNSEGPSSSASTDEKSWKKNSTGDK